MNIRILTADTKELEDEGLYRRFYSFVSPWRKEKTDRMRFMKDKCLSLGAGVLLEAALREAGVRDLQFSSEANGKPRLSLREDIRFNLSHSGTKVLCALSDHDIGCDVEQIRDKGPEIAERFFFREEYEALQNCRASEERRVLFFRFWTLKESFMKATGLGFRLPLDAFSVIPGAGGVTLRQQVDSRQYYFREYDLQDGYRYAVCSADKPVGEAELTVIHFRDLASRCC